MNTTKALFETVIAGAKALLFLSLAGAVIYLSVLSGRTIQQMNESVERIEKDLHGISQNTNAALIQIGLTTDEVRRAAIEQRRYWNETSKETTKTIASVHDLIEHTDRNINEGLLPDAASLVSETHRNVVQIGESTDVALKSLDGTLEQLTVAAAAMTRQAENPDIQKTVAALASTTQNISVATENLSAASKDIRDRVHQMTKPASMAVRIGSTLLGVAAKVGALLAGVK